MLSPQQDSVCNIYVVAAIQFIFLPVEFVQVYQLSLPYTNHMMINIKILLV